MATPRFPTQLLINGATVTGEGRAESVLNPSTGEVLCEVREASADQLRLAVDAASNAFPAWAALTPRERSSYLLQIADAIEANGDDGRGGGRGGGCAHVLPVGAACSQNNVFRPG